MINILSYYSHSDIRFIFSNMISIQTYNSHWHIIQIDIWFILSNDLHYCIWFTFCICFKSWHVIKILHIFNNLHIFNILKYYSHSGIWFKFLHIIHIGICLTFWHMIHILHMFHILTNDWHSDKWLFTLTYYSH